MTTRTSLGRPFVRALWGKKYEVQINRKKLKRIALTGCREQWNFTTMCLLQGCFCDMKWQGTFHVNYLLFYLCFYGLLRCKNSMLDLHIVFETVRTSELNKDDTKGCFKVDGESQEASVLHKIYRQLRKTRRGRGSIPQGNKAPGGYLVLNSQP